MAKLQPPKPTTSEEALEDVTIDTTEDVVDKGDTGEKPKEPTPNDIMAQCLKEYGRESDIPINHPDYWPAKRKVQSV